LNKLQLLEKELDYKRYTRKHRKSVYTYFIHNYILPVRFNYDKRRMHHSSLICSGQMTREEALKDLKKPAMSEKEAKQLIEYVCDKFEISEKEFKEMMKLPLKTYYDYPSYDNHLIYRMLRDVYKRIVEY
jgi:hypothetical protein